jgi:methylenetetrahydrofolate reductase (NADPH)
MSDSQRQDTDRPDTPRLPSTGPGQPPSPVVPIQNAMRVSFEFFPPRTPELESSLWSAIDRLAPLRPRFLSVTYGAGGGTRWRTHEIVRRIRTDTGIPPAAHLTCVGATREEVDRVVRGYRDAGVRHIVALRGDPPGGEGRFEPHPGGYRDSVALIEGIRRIGDFEVSVGCYPEVHPDASSPQADLDHLKRKIDAGASRAITQFFFEPETYLRFVDRARAAGIGVPIVPGILPVSDYAKMERFARACGARVPAWLTELFTGLDESAEVRRLMGATVAAVLCDRLSEQGVREFHFYTLNRSELTFAICRQLGLQPRPASSAANVRGSA